MAAATAAALASSILSRLASAASARIDLDRAIRPSNTTHSASAIDEIASITSSDGSSRSRLLSLERASVLPIRPSAHAADIATPRLRSSRRSIRSKISSGNGRAQRQALARTTGSGCCNSCRKAADDKREPRRAAALSAICNPGPCATARSIVSETASAASRPPIRARASIAAACSGIRRRVPNPAKRRHSAASAGTAAASCLRPASAASSQLSARSDSAMAAINTSSSMSADTMAGHGLGDRSCSASTPRSEKRSSCSSSIGS